MHLHIADNKFKWIKITKIIFKVNSFIQPYLNSITKKMNAEVDDFLGLFYLSI